MPMTAGASGHSPLHSAAATLANPRPFANPHSLAKPRPLATPRPLANPCPLVNPRPLMLAPRRRALAGPDLHVPPSLYSIHPLPQSLAQPLSSRRGICLPAHTTLRAAPYALCPQSSFSPSQHPPQTNCSQNTLPSPPQSFPPHQPPQSSLPYDHSPQIRSPSPSHIPSNPLVLTPTKFPPGPALPPRTVPKCQLLTPPTSPL